MTAELHAALQCLSCRCSWTFHEPVMPEQTTALAALFRCIRCPNCFAEDPKVTMMRCTKMREEGDGSA